MNAPWHFFRAGSVERYTWRDAYARVSHGGVCYPWLTKREAQKAAREAGAKAVFHDSEALAKAASLASEAIQ